MFIRICRSASAALALIVTAAAAAEATDTAEPQEIEEVIVVAHPLSGEGLSQASDVLQGAELERKLAANIGATLGRQPGIHNAQFGNAVGRPVIHGLGGPRVRIMEDRIDALDVSVTSADHAVTVEPFIAERVEVLKGSSTLLYGTGAIGGVVDVHTGRIPHTVPEQALSGGIQTRYETVNDGRSTAAKLNGGGGNFAWHLDGTWKDADDYRIPGFAESAALRAAEEEEEEEEGEEHEEEEEARRRLPGSDHDTSSYAGGVAYVDDWGFVGLSVSRITSDYGLPGGHGHEEEEEEEEGEEHEEEEGNPLLDMEQTRTDLELGVKDPFGPFTSLNLRLGINDYEHQEIEPSGEVATDFSNEAWELRGELVYETGAWAGAVGLQHTDREFSAIGEEAFVPPVDSTDSGVFWVGEREFDNLQLETGLRLGRVSHDPSVGSDEDFNTYAASLGVVVPVTDLLKLSVLLDVSSRAPVAEELYSNGPHIVTNAFEVGDPDLDEEQATSLSTTLAYDSEAFGFALTLYYTEFSDFIYEQATGAEEDGLPVFQFQQEDATFIGADAEVTVNVASWDNGYLALRGQLDAVHAELDVAGNDNLPRIPPFRYGAGLTGKWGPVRLNLDYLRVTQQDDTSDFELVSPAYEDLQVQLDADIPTEVGVFNLFVKGKNLTDDEQRIHTSFIKEFAPAPGRTVEVGASFRF